MLIPLFDVHTLNAFSQTCSSNYGQACNTYKNEQNFVNGHLLQYPEQCGLMSVNTYVASLTHFSQKNDVLMVAHLISAENTDQKAEREKICTFFSQHPAYDTIENKAYYTMLACQGQMHQNSKVDMQKRIVIGMHHSTRDRQCFKVLIKNKLFLNTLFSGIATDPIPYLYWATSHKDAEIIQLLAKVGADMNITGDRRGKTLLHFVVTDPKDPDLVALLIKCGADVNKKDKLNHTPFDYAASDEIKNLLIDNGAEIAWYNKIKMFFS